MTAWSLARGRDRLLPIAILATLALLATGLILPVMTVERFFVFSQRFSILESLHALYRAREYFLFATVGMFSVVFPVTKLVACFALWCFTDAGGAVFHRFTVWIDHIGRWSMLDVFLVAILLVIIRTQGVGGARTELGLYVFAAAVIASVLTAQWINAAAKRIAR
jgi:paraquat-inducible protein A